MLKWKLMLTTLPIVAAVVALRYVLENHFGLAGLVDFADVSAVLAAAAFLVGFLLAGTMSDYKESERLPSELVTTLETLDDLIAVSSIRPGFDPQAARATLIALGERIADWFAGKTDVAAVQDAIDAMLPHYQSIDRSGSTPHANRSIVFTNALRRLVGRIDVIRRTGFLPTAYAIVQTMVAIVVALTLFSRFKTPVAEYTLIVCITLIYVYMLRLIADVDDPFDYAADLERRGAAEVELFPLQEFLVRARARQAAGTALAAGR